MGDPVPSSAISDATTGGLSVIVITGGSTGQVLTLQANGTYAPATVSAGIGGSVGSTDNRLVRSDGTGGITVQSTGITVDDSNNITGIAGLTASGTARAAAFYEPSSTTGWYMFPSGMYGYVAGGQVFVLGSAGFTSNGAITATGLMCAGTYTAGTLPSAAANAYKFANVSDSSVTTHGSTVAGGGSSKVMVYSNGTNWTVCAA